MTDAGAQAGMGTDVAARAAGPTEDPAAGAAKPTGRAGRNSKVELLRIVSMWVILAHHFVIHNADSLAAFPSPFARAALGVLAYPMGKPAVVVFVVISVWYLLDRDLTLRSSFKRVWLLDRQLIFYSVAFALVSGAVAGALSAKSLVLALFPLMTCTWWFATDYALLLVFLPFLVKGLRALGRTGLRDLSLLILALFGVLMFVPKFYLASAMDSLFVEFVCVTVLTAYIRWYVPPQAIASHRRALAAVSVAGVFLVAACLWLKSLGVPVVSAVAQSVYSGVVSNPTCVVSLAIAVPPALLALTSAPVVWKPVNALASVSFGVYLLTDNGFMRNLLWKQLLTFSAIGHLEWGVLLAVGVVTGVYLAASAVDALRELAFRATVDRHRGRAFDRLADRVCGTAGRG